MSLFQFIEPFEFTWAFLNFEINVPRSVPFIAETDSWILHLVRFPWFPLFHPFQWGGVINWRSRFPVVSLFEWFPSIIGRFSGIDFVYIYSNSITTSMKMISFFAVFGSIARLPPHWISDLHVNNWHWVPLFFAIPCSPRYNFMLIYAQFWLLWLRGYC